MFGDIFVTVTTVYRRVLEFNREEIMEILIVIIAYTTGAVFTISLVGGTVFYYLYRRLSTLLQTVNKDHIDLMEKYSKIESKVSVHDMTINKKQSPNFGRKVR